MSQGVVACAAVEDVAALVHQVLCERDSLDRTQTPLFRTPLVKAGRVCGIVFHVEGPRLLRTSAVWSADDDRILFYDSCGLRFHEVRLSESPQLGAEGELRAAA
jgi:hypothetical protein